jgi:hypothetical protein
MTACQTGAADRPPNASALGAASSRLLKAAPTAASSPGSAKVTDPGPISLDVQGNEPGRAVSLSDGLTIFRVAHRATAHFRATLLDENDQLFDGIAAGEGAYDGSSATSLGAPCDC